LPTAKVDNQILAVVIHLQRRHPERPVILVSKDINMRIKARVLGLQAQDYFNDKVLEDTDLLYTGMRELGSDFWDQYATRISSPGRRTVVRCTASRGPLCAQLLVNQFLIQEGEKPAACHRPRRLRTTPRSRR
jgi:PhoH-like ATPase